MMIRAISIISGKTFASAVSSDSISANQATAPEKSSPPIVLILGATRAQWQQFGPAIERAGYRVVLVGSTDALPEGQSTRPADLVVYQSGLEGGAVLESYRAAGGRPELIRLVEGMAFPETGFDPAEQQPCDPAGFEQLLRCRLSVARGHVSVEDDRVLPKEPTRPSLPLPNVFEGGSRTGPHEGARWSSPTPRATRRHPFFWMALLLVVTLVLVGMWRGRPSRAAPPEAAIPDFDLTAKITQVLPSYPKAQDAVNIRIAIHNRGTQPAVEFFRIDLHLAQREQSAPDRPWSKLELHGATWLMQDPAV